MDFPQATHGVQLLLDFVDDSALQPMVGIVTISTLSSTASSCGVSHCNCERLFLLLLLTAASGAAAAIVHTLARQFFT